MVRIDPFYAGVTYLFKSSKKGKILHGAKFFTAYGPESIGKITKEIISELELENMIYIDGSCTAHAIPRDIVPFITVGDRQKELDDYKKEFMNSSEYREMEEGICLKGLQMNVLLDRFVEFCKTRFCVSTL